MGAANITSIVQYLFPSSTLGGLPTGATLTGISFRVEGGTPANLANIDFTQYDVTFTNTSATALSLTFANNEVGGTLVRSGSLQIGQNSVPVGSTPNAFLNMILFTTPFTYTGGNLVVSLRTTGDHRSGRIPRMGLVCVPCSTTI